MKHHNKPSSIRTPLQSTTKSGKNIFVYIRRSTTNKQELSLQKQEDNARETLERNGFHENDVEYYIESKTAFNKVRVDDGKVIERRKEFERMLKDIDNSSEPVTILTYEHSRLSRNDYDSQAILDRLFNEYKDRTKGSIEKIMFNDGEIWDKDTKDSNVKHALLRAYTESETIGYRAQTGMMRQLKNGRYILKTPLGIDRIKNGEQALKINEKMPFIKKAWEMKADLASNREITEYLKEHDIEINTGLSTLFQTLIYAGFWIDPETGELVEQRFVGGKPPISWELYQKVQEALKKSTEKNSHSFKYGSKQEGGVIAKLLKWEEDNDKRFSMEKAKGKYASYKSNAFGGFNMSERKILMAFCSGPLLEIMEVYVKIFRRLHEELQIKGWEQYDDTNLDDDMTELSEEELHKKLTILDNCFSSKTEEELASLEELYKKGSTISLKSSLYHVGLDPNLADSKSKEEIKSLLATRRDDLKKAERGIIYPLDVLRYTRNARELKDDLEDIEREIDKIIDIKKEDSIVNDEFIRFSYTVDKISESGAKEAIKQLLLKNVSQDYEGDKVKKQNQIKKLEREIEDTEKEIKIIQKNGLLKGYEKEIVDELVQDKYNEINTMKEKINNLSQETEIEGFIDALPDILAKTFELSKKAFIDKDFEQSREDIMKLVEITTFELEINNKKELRIKLFDWLASFEKVDFRLWLGY